MFQIIDKLPEPPAILGWLSVGCLAVSGAATLVSLWFLAASIYPQRFDYVAREPALLGYAWDLIHEEQAPDNLSQEKPVNALVTLRTEVARQYAEAADHNRQINKRRERRGSVAGLAALCSVLMTVSLVAITYAHYLSRHGEKGKDDAAVRSPAASTEHPGDHPRGHAGQ